MARPYHTLQPHSGALRGGGGGTNGVKCGEGFWVAVELWSYAFPPHPEFLESLEPDLPALRAMGLHLWAAGSETHPAGITDFLAEASAEVDGPVPGYLSAPQNIMDTCLYIFTSGTTGEGWTRYLPPRN